ncbi:MAG: hypothetical protein M1828_000301 [Chrysothrix sp. TS-e1954]|nr:MAG: hypothetical protein M1828_000301 [Chrysothrix sp. TS-e1954]
MACLAAALGKLDLSKDDSNSTTDVLSSYAKDAISIGHIDASFWNSTNPFEEAVDDLTALSKSESRLDAAREKIKGSSYERLTARPDRSGRFARIPHPSECGTLTKEPSSDYGSKVARQGTKDNVMRYAGTFKGSSEAEREDQVQGETAYNAEQAMADKRHDLRRHVLLRSWLFNWVSMLHSKEAAGEDAFEDEAFREGSSALYRGPRDCEITAQWVQARDLLS